MTWTPADQHRPHRDTTAVAQAIEHADSVDKLLAAEGTGIHRSLELMRTWSDTGIRAARTDTTNGPTPMWCDTHQRDRRRCPVPELCPGHPYRPGADPVGELAADHHDQAAADRLDLLRLLELRASTDQRIARLAERYTSSRPTAVSGPGAHHCASCYRWRQTLTEIDLRPDGRPRYIGLCRNCGEFKSAYDMLPPLAVLEAWHTPGMVATEALVEAAVAKHRAPAKPRRRGARARSSRTVP